MSCGPQQAVDARLMRGVSTRLDDSVCACLDLSADEDLSEAGMVTTPGWDALRHIKMLLTIKQKFAVEFSSRDIAQTQLYQGIRDLLVSMTTQP